MSKPILPRSCFVEHAALQLHAAASDLFTPDDRRITRAVQLVRRGHVHPGADLLTYQVRSATDPTQAYSVHYQGLESSCTCPNYAPKHPCKHAVAVYLVVRASQLEWILERARTYYQAKANRNALAAKARAGTASERELAHLAFLNRAIEPLGRERFERYGWILDLSGLCPWQQRVMRGGA